MKITNDMRSSKALTTGPQFPADRSISSKKRKNVCKAECLFAVSASDVSVDGPTNVILLSHIPMSRSEMADCGPLRERGGIRRGAGMGYQTMLGKQTTAFLLKNLDPMVVFRYIYVL